MPKVIVTGFKPFSLLTWCTGNPSEAVAIALGERYGNNALVRILKADPTCLTEIEQLALITDISGIMMFGASLQISPLVLELEGVSKSDGLLGAMKNKIRSTAAHRFSEHAHKLGLPVARAPITPLVYWCLRSYAAALEWAEPKGIPCIFLHVNSLRFSSATQVEIASSFFKRMVNDHPPIAHFR